VRPGSFRFSFFLYGDRPRFFSTFLFFSFRLRGGTCAGSLTLFFFPPTSPLFPSRADLKRRFSTPLSPAREEDSKGIRSLAVVLSFFFFFHGGAQNDGNRFPPSDVKAPCGSPFSSAKSIGLAFFFPPSFLAGVSLSNPASFFCGCSGDRFGAFSLHLIKVRLPFFPMNDGGGGSRPLLRMIEETHQFFSLFPGSPLWHAQLHLFLLPPVSSMLASHWSL